MLTRLHLFEDLALTGQVATATDVHPTFAQVDAARVLAAPARHQFPEAHGLTNRSSSGARPQGRGTMSIDRCRP